MIQVCKRYWRRVRSWLRYEKPSSATIKEWRVFRKQFRKNAPVRYFLMERLPRLYRAYIARPAHNAVWWVRHRVHPHHRYHIIKTGMKPGYADIDVRMTYAVFSLVCDFVEIELGLWQDGVSKKYRSRERGVAHMKAFIAEFEHDSMEADQVNLYRNLLELYVWWNDVYLKYDPLESRGINPMRVYKDQESLLDLFSNEDLPVIVSIQCSRWMMANEARSAAFDEETDRMLLRAIEIRRLLWS